uniref:Uncharacterized protein n=1 Tax=Rhizophora mucronata TaxID=61149 RepID=A0A2P2M6K9_RHIMU
MVYTLEVPNIKGTNLQLKSRKQSIPRPFLSAKTKKMERDLRKEAHFSSFQRARKSRKRGKNGKREETIGIERNNTTQT